MSLAVLSKSPKSVAPGQYLGYSLQQVRLCFHLLTADDGDEVSLEFLDDVAVHRADGSLALEQAKSALNGNPVSDKSEDLWKTFANWSDLVGAGAIDADKTDFALYVTPTKAGKVVGLLHAATSAIDVLTALATVKELLDPTNPDIGCGLHLARFLKAGDGVCSRIIARFQLITEDDPVAAVIGALQILPPEIRKECSDAAVGMARDRIDKLIRDDDHPVLSAERFRHQFWSFVRRHNLINILISRSSIPTPDEVSHVVDAGRLFVRQLQAIEAQPDMLVTAVSDWMRTTADKIQWADEGTVYEGSFDELDERLQRDYALVRDEVEDVMSTGSHAQRGRAVYRKCTAKTFPLEGRELPSHFIPGAFNCLADARHLGWHPDYLTLFPEE